MLLISSFVYSNGQNTTEKTYLINNDFISGPTKYRIEAGYSAGHRFPKNTSGVYGIQSLYLGASTEFELSYKIKLQTALFYNIYMYDKTQKYKNYVVAKYSTFPGHSLDIPIQAKYDIQLVKSFSMFFYLGPTLNIGLSNKEDIFVDKGNLTDEEFDKYNELIQLPESGIYEQFGNAYRRFNLSLDVGGGLQWRNYIVKGGYSYGLTNMSKTKGGKLHEGGWYAGLAFEF